jgi:hypothetical protein
MKNIQCRMVEWFTNYELEGVWKEVSMAWSRYCASILLKELRKTTNILSQYSRSYVQDSKQASSEYKYGALYLPSTRWPVSSSFYKLGSIYHFRKYGISYTHYFWTNIRFLDIIHRPVTQTVFCLRLQVKPSQLGPIDRASPCLRT